MPKSYTLTINNLPLTLTLTPPPSWGYCAGCLKEKGIRIISQPTSALKRKFCQNCALDKLDELWEYEFENREQIIKELRRSLLISGENQENHV